MALRIFVLSAAVEPAPSVLLKGRRATLGRAEDSHVRIPDPSVSAHHATIIKRGENYLLLDEGSRLGTAAGPWESLVWLAPESPRILRHGEHVLLGQIELRVELVASQKGEATGQEELARTLVRHGLQAAGFEATPQLIESTLDELTALEDGPIKVEESEPLHEPVGVAALAAEDRHPPWKTDLMIGLLALLIAGGCAFSIWRLDLLSSL